MTTDTIAELTALGVGLPATLWLTSWCITQVATRGLLGAWGAYVETNRKAWDRMTYGPKRR